jgi:predicted aldo/keto reductase-like oxidoreductase
VRDKLYVATKIKPSSSTRKEVFEDVETSLSKLGTDRIDVIQMHSLTRAEQILAPEVREAFLQLRKQGKVRFFGVTTHTNQAEVINALVDDPEQFFDTVLVAYNFKSGKDLRDAVARASGAGIGVVAMKTQAGGYQTDALGSLSPHQAALRWVLRNPAITAAIPGMKDMSHLREDLSVMGMMALSRRDERILARYGEAIHGEYCHMCGACEGLCPNHVAISTINRCLMYAKAYGSLDLAKNTYREIEPPSSASACGSCAECTVTCVNGVNVRAKMEEAHRTLT